MIHAAVGAALPHYYVGFFPSGNYWWVFIVLAIVSGILRSNRRARRRRSLPEQRRPREPFPGPSGRPDFSDFDATYKPPPADFEPLQGSPAEARAAAERELAARLAELDGRRRSGVISAEEYARERERIFRNP